MSELASGGEVLRQPLPYVVHGSFRKHLDNIADAIATINATGLAVAIAPHDCVAVSEQDGFVKFAGEEDQDPRLIEAKYLRDALEASAADGFSLFVNPGGYMGNAARYEAGAVHASGGRVFFTEQPEDVSFYVHPGSIQSPEQIAELLARF